MCEWHTYRKCVHIVNMDIVHLQHKTIRTVALSTMCKIIHTMGTILKIHKINLVHKTRELFLFLLKIKLSWMWCFFPSNLLLGVTKMYLFKIPMKRIYTGKRVFLFHCSLDRPVFNISICYCSSVLFIL